MRYVPVLPVGILGLSMCGGMVCLAETLSVPTAEDYARAERFLPHNTSRLVLHRVEEPMWLQNGTLLYRTRTERGKQFVLADPMHGTRKPAFDHEKIAAELSRVSKQEYKDAELPFDTFEFSDDGKSILFEIGTSHWECDIGAYRCRQAGGAAEVVAPNGRRAVFIRDFNLWMRDVITGQETQLSTDGTKEFDYATDNAGWRRSDEPVVLWCSDSRRIATYQQDERDVEEMYLVRTQRGHPELLAWKYPLAGDPVVTTIQRVIIDVDAPRVVRLQMPPDERRSPSQYDVRREGTWRKPWSREGGLADAQWNSDCSRLAFISTSRDNKVVQLRIAEADTGAVRNVIKESMDTFYESDTNERDAVNWHYLEASNEIIWFSERDNWGHLYLYDAETGKLKNRITSGQWNVLQLLKVDQRKRLLYFIGVGRETNRDPYFEHLYRIGLDGTVLTLLTPETATHEVTIAPVAEYFLDTYSTPVVPPTSVLRDLDGRVIQILGKADISRLMATGWKPPVPVTVKARDGITDLYGLMFTPTNFDPGRQYPLVNSIYPGPQIGSVGHSRRFMPSRGFEGDAQSLAELGFIVVQIDGMGTPFRSKTFHDSYYGNMGDNTLPDQVLGMKQLAQRYSWIDIDRAGIYGISGGGYAAARAMFDYPDFFKAAVSTAGNHDQRSLADIWGEKFIGLIERKPDGTSNYDSQANQNVAKHLKGHLLLTHGMMDDVVPPYLTFLLVDALIAANKDFDLMIIPQGGHKFPEREQCYVTRRRWDYFVRHLLGVEPPREYEICANVNWSKP